MVDQQLMYEGEGSLREGPFSAQFAPIERLVEIYRTPETLRAIIVAAVNALRGNNSGHPGLAR